ncbi:MAG TPA: hypothetical protein VIT83_05850 [Gammaproteobacteria bacterium]
MDLKAIFALLGLLILLVMSVPGISGDDLVVYGALGGIALVGVVALLSTRLFSRKTDDDGE